MATSDSEDFESADEGSNEGSFVKRDRRKRISSSNYSDSRDSDHELLKIPASSPQPPPAKTTQETGDGWGDFDIDDAEPIGVTNQKNTPTRQPEKLEPVTEDQKNAPMTEPVKLEPVTEDEKIAQTMEPEKVGSVKQDQKNAPPTQPEEQQSVTKKKQTQQSEDTGWDEFDDWGESDGVKEEPTPTQPNKLQAAESGIKSLADRLSTTTVKEPVKDSGWGWGGWGVESLLSTATAGISTITNQVSQGITTALESGIGAPDPVELARRTAASEDEKPDAGTDAPERDGEADAFAFGGILSGVTKFVENTGTKVLAGGLDTLETIGKKTMEVLQDGDPGLAKKRAMLGLEAGDTPRLSEVLREARERADEDDRIQEERREKKELHFETLFDDFEGLVHLEALEMLSRQSTMRIDEKMRAVDNEKKMEIRETLQQVSELCEMPDDEDDEEAALEGFHERLQQATRDLGARLHFPPLVKHYTDTLSWLDTAEAPTSKAVFKLAVSSLAQYAAHSVELYHKSAEMLLVKPRRSTADEADGLAQMTAVLRKHIRGLATSFTQKLNSLPEENKDQVNGLVTSVFLNAGYSEAHVQNAFKLTLPVLQVGAV